MLVAGWDVRGPRRAMLVAATRHAVDFSTWRSLARDGGVRRAGVVELASAMVSRALLLRAPADAPRVACVA